MNFADYRIEENGRVLCEPCLSFVFFSGAQLSKDLPPDLLGPYRVFLENFRDSVTYCRMDGDQMHATRITEEDLALLPNWLADPKRRAREEAMAELRTGQSRDEWRAPCLDFSHHKDKPQRTYYRICVTLDWYDNAGLEGVLHYAIRSLTDFPLQYGYIGYSFAWEHSDPHVEDVTALYFRSWLLRHPGILIPNPLSHHIFSSYGLPDIGWITLLGKAYCERLGGLEALRQSTAAIQGVVAEPFPEEGAMIRIGEAPRLGDVFQGDILEDYRTVGKLLSSLRNRDILLERMVVDGMVEDNLDGERKQWIDRFFPQIKRVVRQG